MKKNIWERMDGNGAVYAFALIAWLILLIPAYKTADRSYNEARRIFAKVNNIPTLSPKAMEERINDLKKRAMNVSTNPRDWWKIVDEWNEVNEIYYQSEGVAGDTGEYGRLAFQLGGFGFMNLARQAHWDRHGSEVMNNVAEEENAKRSKYPPRVSRPDAPSFPLVWMLKIWYLSSFWIAGFVFLLRLKACRLSVLLELMAQPWKPFLALITWPVAFFIYPNDNPKQQLVAGLRFAMGGLSALLSLGGGTAMAGGKSDTLSKKSRSPWGLQLDGRTNWFIPGDGPVPTIEESLRVTANAPSRLLLETVNIRKDKTWINWSAVGYSLVLRPGLRVNAYGGAVFTSSGSHSPQYGLQCYYNKQRFSILTPVLGMEHQVRPKRSDSFVLTTLPGFWFGKKHLGTEVNLRATMGKSLQWSAGPRVGMKVGRASFIEAGALINQQNDWRLRVRLVHNVLPRAQ